MKQTEIKFFTTDGSDVWVFEKLRLVVDLRNAATGETVTCEKGDPRFRPAEIRVAENKIRANKKAEVKKKSPVRNKTAAESKPRRSKTSKFKGVGKNKDGKFVATYWDGARKKAVHLGVFKGELLAAAAYQEHIGKKKEADRLREEHQEGDGPPEPDSKHKTRKSKIIGTDKRIEDLKGPVTYICAGCGQDYEVKTLKCIKCGSCAIEPVRLAAAAATPAVHTRRI